MVRLYWAAAAFFLALIICQEMPGITEAQSPPENRAAGGPVQVVAIDGPIGPATSDFVKKALSTAYEQDAPLVILTLDTPGGLAESMRAVIRHLLDSSVPVAAYVYPSGARAASAGAYIFYACHIAAMAPGTNLGAATPVQVGGGLPGLGDKEDPEEGVEENSGGRDAMEAKIVEDSVAYIRSLAHLRGRNAEWAEKSVRQGASLPVEDAVEMNVADLTALDLVDLLAKTDGRTVTVKGREVILRTRGLSVETIEPGWRIRLLEIITNPNIAMILMLIGIYGIIYEFANPGFIGPGVVGVICLLLGLYGLHVLPVNYAGLALFVLGLALMVAEVFAPSFGILGIGGTAAFILGAAILVEVDAPGFRISWPVILGSALLSAAVLILLLGYIVKVHRRPVKTGAHSFSAGEAEVMDWSGDKGHIRIHGERWEAEGPRPLAPGDRVRVVESRGLTLLVEPLENQSKGEKK